MKKGLIIFGVVVLLVVIAASALIGNRNQLVAANEAISATWAQVDNVIQRRADLIPNLVATVKGYAKQEKEIFVSIAEARAKLAGAKSVDEKIAANEQIGSTLSRLLVIVEQYPQLKSNQNFVALQDELAGTENRITIERMRFNEAVKTYNLLVTLFPSNISARIFGFEKRKEYFSASPEAKQVPKVNFN